MAANKTFDTSKSDAQASLADPVKVADFCFSEYAEYVQKLTKRCEAFMKSRSGVLVYRRMRVAEVFSYGCKEMKRSLEWQLGALKKVWIIVQMCQIFWNPGMELVRLPTLSILIISGIRGSPRQQNQSFRPLMKHWPTHINWLQIHPLAGIP